MGKQLQQSIWKMANNKLQVIIKKLPIYWATPKKLSSWMGIFL